MEGARRDYSSQSMSVFLDVFTAVNKRLLISLTAGKSRPCEDSCLQRKLPGLFVTFFVSNGTREKRRENCWRAAVHSSVARHIAAA